MTLVYKWEVVGVGLAVRLHYIVVNVRGIWFYQREINLSKFEKDAMFSLVYK